jgi:hypothetical protein
MNKEQIATLSDTELTDHIPVLKQFAPELLTEDGRINWSKVEEYANSDDLFKQRIANYLSKAKKMREEYANLPIGVKLEKMKVYSEATDPLKLQKEFVVERVLEKYNEMIDKADLPEDLKFFLRANAPFFAEMVAQNPTRALAYIKALENVSKKKQDTTQEERSGGWRLSLDGQGQKKFGISLEEPQLTSPQVSPPQVSVAGQRPVGAPKVGRQRLVDKQGEGATKTGQKSSVNKQRSGRGITEEKSDNNQRGGTTFTSQQSQIGASDDIIFPSEVPYAPDVKSKYSREQLLNFGSKVLDLAGNVGLALSLLALTRNPIPLLKKGLDKILKKKLSK